jgi:hypothetical protein
MNVDLAEDLFSRSRAVKRLGLRPEKQIEIKNYYYLLSQPKSMVTTHNHNISDLKGIFWILKFNLIL